MNVPDGNAAGHREEDLNHPARSPESWVAPNIRTVHEVTEAFLLGIAVGRAEEKRRTGR